MGKKIANLVYSSNFIAISEVHCATAVLTPGEEHAHHLAHKHTEAPTDTQKQKWMKGKIAAS